MQKTTLQSIEYLFTFFYEKRIKQSAFFFQKIASLSKLSAALLYKSINNSKIEDNKITFAKSRYKIYLLIVISFSYYSFIIIFYCKHQQNLIFINVHSFIFTIFK